VVTTINTECCAVKRSCAITFPSTRLFVCLFLHIAYGRFAAMAFPSTRSRFIINPHSPECYPVTLSQKPPSSAFPYTSNTTTSLSSDSTIPSPPLYETPIAHREQRNSAGLSSSLPSTPSKPQRFVCKPRIPVSCPAASSALHSSPRSFSAPGYQPSIPSRSLPCLLRTFLLKGRHSLGALPQVPSRGERITATNQVQTNDSALNQRRQL
jgi:hypothetical protein